VLLLHRDGSDKPLDKMSVLSSRTRKCLSRNTGKLKRSKIGGTCLPSRECVNETRTRQKGRYARVLDGNCNYMRLSWNSRMVKEENERDTDGQRGKLGVAQSGE
jgi:hypothetical protein